MIDSVYQCPARARSGRSRPEDLAQRIARSDPPEPLGGFEGEQDSQICTASSEGAKAAKAAKAASEDEFKRP
eukprot:445696-Rhodomonas_salina.1